MREDPGVSFSGTTKPIRKQRSCSMKKRVGEAFMERLALAANARQNGVSLALVRNGLSCDLQYREKWGRNLWTLTMFFIRALRVIAARHQRVLRHALSFVHAYFVLIDGG
jgi:hypothetical protein